MLFLRENFEKRATSGNLSVPRHVNEATDETLFEFDEDEEDAHTSNSLATTLPTSGLSQQGSLPVTPSSTPPTSGEVLGYRKRSRPLDPIGKELVEIEKEKLKMRKEKENQTLDKNDEDVAFFTSLLPHMKRMAPVDKIMFRIEVEKLVVEKAYGVEYGSLNRRDDNLPHTSTQSRARFPPPLSSDNILPYGGPHFPALLHPNPASYSHTALPPPHRSEIDVPGSSQMNRSSVQSVNNPGFDGGQVYNNMQNMPM